mmetsp:Transcript_73875/g.171361  ORF Transcript_73875/g.171361 Transcript_73875/m.171361 type:complete len:156 (+) Transcript_73875:70-537(+)|eukprot:CAMPEP_0171091782 /NCGR_PEP_ID=MMETSP0766_2-20121228/35319_1 /TAXON_ID=439317 /ORGANISM="Gambierdiscus australes, Strain CAWD 149" /LENGTH=155 /DNA_ID=CAMNT_0011549945 /DNA_START=70 /DNA_END=537 /DNA_ORIENTATION=-
MAQSVSAVLLALVFAISVVAEKAAVRGAGTGHSSARASLAEEVKAFESSAATLDTEGWSAFLESSSHSARSEHDRSRQRGLDDRVSVERSVDISVSDHFANNVAEQSDMPTLRQLAKQHWDGLGAPTQQDAKDQQQPAPKPSLRHLLMSAGQKGP